MTRLKIHQNNHLWVDKFDLTIWRHMACYFHIALKWGKHQIRDLKSSKLMPVPLRWKNVSMSYQYRPLGRNVDKISAVNMLANHLRKNYHFGGTRRFLDKLLYVIFGAQVSVLMIFDPKSNLYNHFGWVFSKLWSDDFTSTSPQISQFLAKNSIFWSHRLPKTQQTYQSFIFKVKLHAFFFIM